MAKQSWTDFDTFLKSRFQDITPSAGYKTAYGSENYNPLLDYQLSSGVPMGSITAPGGSTWNDPGFLNWQKSQILGGKTPEQYIASLNQNIGLGGNNITGNDRGGYAYNPSTGQVMTRSFDDEFDPGNLIGAGLAAGVGALSGGFGLGELFKGAGADMPWGVNAAKDAGTAGTGGGMDWWTELGLSPQDVGMDVSPWTTNPGMADLTGGVLTDAGSTAGWAADMAPKGLWDTIKGIPSSALKALGLTKPDGSFDLSALGKLGAAGLGAYGANEQSNRLSDLAAKYAEYGAPSRARFEQSMTPGFDPMSIPGYSGALDTASKGILARLSASGGNPFGNPGGLIDANKQIVAGTALPAINEYQRLNLSAGGLGNLNAAVPALQQGAIGQQGNVLNSFGYGLNALTNPQPSLADMIKALQLGGLT